MGDVGGIADDGPGFFAGASGVELGLIGVDGIDFLLPEGGNVEAEGGGEVDAEVSAEVVEDAAAIVGVAGDGGFGEFGVEAGVFADAGDGEVIGVGVGGVREKEDVGAEGAVEGGDAVAGFEGMGDFAVFEAGIEAGDAEDFGGGGGFLGAGFFGAEGGGFAGGHVNEGDVVAGGGEEGDGAAHGEFLVVGMGAEDGDVHAFIQYEGAGGVWVNKYSAGS